MHMLVCVHVCMPIYIFISNYLFILFYVHECYACAYVSEPMHAVSKEIREGSDSLKLEI